MPAEFERLQQRKEEAKKEKLLIGDDKIIEDRIIIEQAVPDVTEKDAAQAEEILNFLESPAEGLEIETPDGLSVVDLHRDVQSFQRQIAVLSTFELEVPGLSIDDGSPVPIRFDLPSVWSLLPGRDEEVRERYKEVVERYNVVMPVEEAKTSFHSRASAFLATRIAAAGP